MALLACVVVTPYSPVGDPRDLPYGSIPQTPDLHCFLRSAWWDSNPRPRFPQKRALPDCATRCYGRRFRLRPSGEPDDQSPVYSAEGGSRTHTPIRAPGSKPGTSTIPSLRRDSPIHSIGVEVPMTFRRCARRDSNPHALSSTRISALQVYLIPSLARGPEQSLPASLPQAAPPIRLLRGTANLTYYTQCPHRERL
jgi:hypothetical protein